MAKTGYLKPLAPQRFAIPLRWLLVVPFVLQTAGAVALVGYLSYRIGQQAVERLADQLMAEVGDNVDHHLNDYLGQAQAINRINRDAVETGNLDLSDFDAVGKYFYRQVSAFDFAFVNFGGADGSFIGAGIGETSDVVIAEVVKPDVNHIRVYSPNDQGDRIQPVTSIPSAVNRAAWYTDATKAGQPIWSSLYTWADIPDRIAISASAPIYDQQNRLLGVLGIDLELSQISQFLKTLNQDRSGTIFIIERSGLLVASSSAEHPIATVDGQLQRLSALNSQDPLTRHTTEDLIERFSNLPAITEPQFFRSALEPHAFVAVSPYRDAYGLDWLVVKVIPESEFMAEIQRNQHTTAVFCLLTLGLAIAAGLLISHGVTTAMARLNQAGQKLAAGDLSQQLPTHSSITEIQELTQSFNQMAAQLRQHFQNQVAAAADRHSEARFQQLAAAVPGMIYTYTQHPDGSHGFDYVSAFSQTILELSPAEVLADVQAVLDQIHPDDRAAYDAAVAHRTLTLEPFTLAFRIITPAGQLKWLEASSQALRQDNGCVTWYGIVLDVSQRAQAEAQRHRIGEQLRRMEQWLHQYSQQSPSLIYTIVQNPDGYVWLEYISAAVEAVHEITLAQVLDNADLLFDQMHPEDRADYQTAVARSAKYLELFSHEWRIITPSGQLKWLQATSQPEQRRDGAIAWYGVVQDISERKRGEAERKQAELALRQALQALNHHIEMSPLATVRWNQDFRVEYWSHQAEKIFGWSAAEVLGKTMYDWQFIFEDDVAYVNQKTAQLFEGTSIVCANRNYHKDGSVLDCEWYNSILLDDQEKLVSIMSIAQDVSDRKHAEAALQQSEERWQLAISGAKDGIWDHNLITNEHFLSPHCLEMLGYSLEEIDTFDQWVELVHPQDRSTLQSTLQQYLNREMPQYAAEYRMRCRDGRYLWILSRGQAIWNEQGTPVRMIGSITDISDRHQTEAALRQSEARLAGILEIAKDAIIAIDERQIITLFNKGAEQIFGYTLEEALGQPLSLLLPERVNTLHRQHVVAFGQVPEQTRQMGARSQVFAQRKDGTEFPAEASISKLRLADKTIFTVFLQDITDRKRAEDERNQAQKALAHSEEQLNLVLKGSNDGWWDWDLANNSLYYSPRWWSIIGYAPGDLETTPTLWRQLMHPEDVDRVDQFFTRQLASSGESYEVEFRLRHRQGHYVPVMSRAYILRDDNGTPVRVSGTNTDLTELKRVTAILRKSEQKFRGAFDTITTGMALVSLVGGFQEVNATLCQMLGYTEEELLALGPEDVVHPLDQAIDLGLAEQMMTGEISGYQVEKRVVRKDGAAVWGLLNIALMRDRNHHPLYLIIQITDISDRKRTVAALQQATQQLEARLHDLNQRHQEMVLLSEISDFLQACLTVEEAYGALSNLLEPLFPGCAGNLFVIDHAYNQAKAVLGWGSPPQSEPEFSLKDCWALRRGRVHWVNPNHAGLRCQHITAQSEAATLCIPMVTQGELSGLFYLSAPRLDALPEAKQQLAHTVAEQVALAIANLQLREFLQEQSIRDPLTGLFNRRYLEESLQQEIARAQRYQHSIGVIMIDIDHFKRVNDTYGHDAGDYVLKTIAQLLQECVRRSDIACRYGGEELTLILPGTALEEAAMRAEGLRTQISHLALNYNNQNLGPLTASFGVACFPNHGLDGAAVVHAADQALYQAKAAGRDRVISAPPEPA